MSLPEQPTWGMFRSLLLAGFAAIVIVAMVLWSLSGVMDDIRENQKAGEIRSRKNRAVACEDIINDGEIMLTTECVDPDIVVYYPPDICEKLAVIGISSADCGDLAIVVPTKQ